MSNGLQGSVIFIASPSLRRLLIGISAHYQIITLKLWNLNH